MTIIGALAQLRDDLIAWVTNNLHTKVTKETGKGLSTNDYTNTEKQKVDGSIKDLSVDGKIITYTKNDGNTETIVTQDTVYEHPETHSADMITGLASVATSGSYNDLENKPTIPSIDGLATEGYVDNAISTIPKIPTNVSFFTNDAGYLTKHQSLDGLASETFVETSVGTHNTATDAHNDIRLLIEGLTTRLNTLADSDDTTLDQMSEIVAYIKSNKELIEGITTNKVNVSDIIDNLTTNVSNKPLSAAQGVALKALIDAIVVPTKVSDLTNDKGYLTSVPSEYVTETELANKKYLTSYTETDPTVPAWAKASTKPTYTASEVGADPAGSASAVQGNLDTHTDNKSNPHGVTAAQVGAPTVAEMNAAIEAIPTPDVSGQINTHNTDTTSHSDIRFALDEKLPKSGGIMTGTLYGNNGIELTASVSSANNAQGITLKNSTNTARFSLGGSGGLGIYSDQTLFIRPAYSEGSGYGVKMTKTDMSPTTNASLSLGTSSSMQYNNIYGKTIYQNGKQVANKEDVPTTKETWTFTLEDGSTVTKAVYVG